MGPQAGQVFYEPVGKYTNQQTIGNMTVECVECTINSQRHAPVQAIDTSSLCEQSCTPHPLCPQLSSVSSLPTHATVSIHMVPVPAPYWFARVRPMCLTTLRNRHITGSAVALHCCKAHAKSIGKMGNSTPCKIVTPENIILKLCIRDYVGEMTHHANFGFNRCSGGFSPNRRNITTL